MAREIRLQYRWVSPHKRPRQAALSSSQLTFDSWEQQGDGGGRGEVGGWGRAGHWAGADLGREGGEAPLPKIRAPTFP